MNSDPENHDAGFDQTPEGLELIALLQKHAPPAPDSRRGAEAVVTRAMVEGLKWLIFKSEGERVIELARREMCAAYRLEPPLEVDAGAGPDWLSAK